MRTLPHLLLLLSVSVCLFAQTTHTQWLGTWKGKAVTPGPVDDPAHLGKESTVVFSEQNGKVRRLESRTYYDGHKFEFDTGYMSWDDQPHQLPSPSDAVVQVREIDSHHLLVIAKRSNGPTITIHTTLSEDGKSYTDVEDVALPDGKTKQYTAIFRKQ